MSNTVNGTVKGHETYQILKSKTIHFDDHEQAGNAISIRLKANTNYFRGSSAGMLSTLFKPSNVNKVCDIKSELEEKLKGSYPFYLI